MDNYTGKYEHFIIDNNYLFSHLDFFTKNLNTFYDSWSGSFRKTIVDNITSYFQTDLNKKIENITDQDIKKIWTNLLNLPDKQYIKTFSDYSNIGNYKQFFDKNNNITSFFLERHISQYQKFDKTDIEKIIVNFSPNDQKFWNIYFDNFSDRDTDARGLLLYFKKQDEYQNYFNENNLPKSIFFEELAKDKSEFTINQETLAGFSENDQKFWTIYFNNFNLSDSYDDKLNGSILRGKDFLFSIKDDYQKYFEGNTPKSDFYFEAYSKGEYVFISPEILETFSSDDKYFWNTVPNLPVRNDLKKIFFDKKEEFSLLFKDGYLTKRFFDYLKESNFDEYKKYFYEKSNKKDWETEFGQETINYFLNSLPTKTDEKRNAFTHNEYDRTSRFLEYLSNIHRESEFKLDQDNLLICADYIKSFGLSKTATIFKHFKDLSLFKQGKIDTPPSIYLDYNIRSVDQLITEVNKFKQICLSQDQLIDLSDFSPFQISLLSMATGHASNRWTRIPIETIIDDFSQDLKSGFISPLPSEFSVSSTQIEKTKTINTVDLSKNQIYQQSSNEILNSIANVDTVEDLKKIASKIINRKIEQLSLKNRNEFIDQQINIFQNTYNNLDQVDSIDNMISTLLNSNINFGQEQEQYNSILRQLVYRKTFTKHQSPDFVEGLRISLENNPGPEAVFNSLNFLNNIVKDHALNFQTDNNEQYWNQETFVTIKKYEKIFKKNLNIPSLTKEMQRISDQFEIIKSDSSLNIEMIPDRGLIGEMAGYMADVCYTKVYPLLKQYPNLVPYKFVSRTDESSSELIGSTLVFKVDTQDNQSAFLIRAFDIPQEQSLNVASLFEKFIDSLSDTAKKMGIKKIIAAGTPGTISNYAVTTNYVLSHYAKDGQQNIPLKETFDFNGYDITNQCYLVRDLKND